MKRKMKIAILSRNAKLYSTRRLVEACEARGHSVQVIDVLRCYMKIAPRCTEIHYRGKMLEGFDAVIPRIGASVTFYGAAVVRQFEMMGTYSLNESVAITRARDKLRAHQLLARHGIGMPVTGFAHSPDDTGDLMNVVGAAPMVIKLIEGTQGQGVVLAETDKAAESVIDAFRGLDAHFLVQRFIAEANGADIRCFVIGKKVVATMMRQAKVGEFRSNLHRGGSALPVKITAAERRTALAAAKAMGLNVAGVDLLRAKDGPVVMEVNSSPGLEGIEGVAQIDIANLIIEFVEKNAKPWRTRTRGRG
jgi:ribosomal protein S6--L-glutamate ligase